MRQKPEQRIDKDLVAASATSFVLAILSKGASYGYAIIQEVRALSGGALEWSEGMLYPVLHRMEDRGLIESYEERGDNGRKRKYYRLVDAAIAAYRTALARQAELAALSARRYFSHRGAAASCQCPGSRSRSPARRTVLRRRGFSSR